MHHDLFDSDPRLTFLELLRKLPGFQNVVSEIDWDSVERALEVKMPSAYRMISNSIGAATLGQGLQWKSPVSRNPYFLLSFDSFQEFARLTEGYRPFPLYPESSGYLIFASGDRLHLAFKVVEESNLGRVCLPAVAVVDMDRDIIEETDIQIDEFLYRAITNKPPLRGGISGRFHTMFFWSRNDPLCEPAPEIW